MNANNYSDEIYAGSKPSSMMRAVWLYCLVALYLVYEMGVQAVPAIIVTDLMRDLHLDAAALGVMAGIYFCSYTLMQIPAGVLYDRFSVRAVLIIPILVCSIGCYLFAVSNHLWDGSIARLLMGFGGAFAYTSVLVVANDVFDKKHFALMAGITQMLAALGGLLGQRPMIPLVHTYGWRGAMEILALAGLFTAILVWSFINYPKEKPVQAKQGHFLSGLFELVKNRQTWIIAVYACALWAPMCIFAALWGVAYLQLAHHLTEASAATINSMMWIGVAVSSPILGWWSNHISARRLPLIVSALIGVVASAILVLIQPLPPFIVGVLVFLIGAACGGQALSFASVKENNPEHLQATALGFNNMAVVISGFIFQPLSSALIQYHWDGAVVNGSPMYHAQDYQLGMILIPMVFLVGLLMSSFGIRESIGSDSTR